MVWDGKTPELDVPRVHRSLSGDLEGSYSGNFDFSSGSGVGMTGPRHHLESRLGARGESDSYALMDLFHHEAQRIWREKNIEGWTQTLWKRFDTPVFLVMLGMTCSLLSFLIQRAVEVLIDARGFFLPHNTTIVAAGNSTGEASGSFGGWLIYTALSVGFAFAGVAIVHEVSPLAVGSGVAEIKSVLSGILYHKFLGFRTFISKFYGLILAESAGFSIGKEGPFVHMACCIANLMMRLPIFRRISRIGSKRLELLGAACAAGVASSFGATFGGVLFSIEVTTTHYMVSHLPQATFAAACGALLVKAIGWGNRFELFSTTFKEDKDHTLIFYFLFIALGIMCGVVGAAFNALIKFLLRAKGRLLARLVVRGGGISRAEGITAARDRGSKQKSFFSLF